MTESSPAVGPEQPAGRPAETAAEPARVEFLARCRAALPGCDIPSVVGTRQIGRTAELCDRLLSYILAGSKTGGFTRPVDFPDGRLPAAGELALLTDSTGAVRCLIRYTHCEMLSFGTIRTEHLQVETPLLRDLAAWRRLHRDYWMPALEAEGQAFSADLPILFQRFEVLFPLIRSGGS